MSDPVQFPESKLSRQIGLSGQLAEALRGSNELQPDFADLALARKCRKVLAYMLDHLAKVLTNPANIDMWTEAAQKAGQTELSAVSREKALGMLREISERLGREK